MITKRDLLIGTVAVCVTLAGITLAQNQKPKMKSSVFDWNAVAVETTKTGARRDFFLAPTTNLDQLECHVTTLNPGEAPHAPHQHPEEELIIVKEGTIEAMQNGVIKLASAGSMIFEASNELHGLRNVGKTAATYYVIKYFPPGTLKPKS
jgi:quercetin dioxygenase-like cupin family protein